MTIHVIDTNVISDLAAPVPKSTVLANLAKHVDDTLCLCEAVDYEIRRGYLKAGALSRLGAYEYTVKRQFQWVTLTENDWKLAAQLWAEAASRGRAFSDIDLLLAAVTIRLNAVIVSADADFDALPNHTQRLARALVPPQLAHVYRVAAVKMTIALRAQNPSYNTGSYIGYRERQIVMKKILLALAVALLALGTLGVMAAPAEAQAISTFWNAQYYSNPNLQGSPAVTRGEGAVAFSWGLGSPDPAIPADNWSARFATDVSLAAGTYRFFVLADDNVRVTFNFSLVPLIDTFADVSRIGQLISAELTVPVSGSYHIQIDYREVTLDAFLYMSFGPAATHTQPAFAAPAVQVPVNPGGSWVAQYYPNTTLSGEPAAILSVISPTNNWGTSAPLGNMPADNFSVRWTGNFVLPAGNYQIAVTADDGVRVFVNGVLLINQFGPATGQTYTANFTSSGGNNTIVVEYVEFAGNAFIDYRLTQQFASQQPQPQPQQPSGATATVAAFRLNVREAPSPTAAILTRINRNEVYPIIARNSSGTWYQINANGIIGWVSAGFIVIANGANVPVVGAGAPAPTPAPTTPPPVVSPTGITATASPFNVNIRQGPGTSFSRIGLLPRGQTAAVLGRNAANTWWQIEFGGVRGWVSAQFAPLNSGANVNSLPITG